MAANPPERALRRMLLRLQSLPREDFDAIVEKLENAERQRVLGLLSELEGQGLASNSDTQPADFAEVILPTGISSWLAARVNGSNDSGDETLDHFCLTPKTQAALRKSAASLLPQPKKAVRPISLLGRVWSGFA